MKYHCECKQCKNNEFNPEDYIIKEDDFKILDKERPLGLSGHLRVKDEAMSIAECIDSCIDALDELIITYNKSSDNTENILKEYEKKYPDKIRLYFYAPNIIKYDKDEYKIKYSELHYFYYYSNFGYLKIRYKYYIKIDSDQIYFTEKLFEIREALLSDIKLSDNIRKLLIISKISLYIPIKKLRNNFRTYFIKKAFSKKEDYYYDGIENILSFRDFIIYNRYLYKDNCSFELGGINLILNNKELLFNTDFIFNGCVGDHFIFIAKSINKYHLLTNGLEGINTPDNKCMLGFLWVHLGELKRKKVLQNNDNIKVLDIASLKWENIIKYTEFTKEEDFFMYNMHIDFGKKYFDNDKKYINNDFYDRYLNKPLEYAINHYEDKIERLW